MKKQSSDDEVVTQKVLRLELKDLRAEIKLQFAEFEVRMDKKFDEKFNHHFGLMIEYFNDKFAVMFEGFKDIPAQVIRLREQTEQNDEEHRNFRVRIGALE